MGIKVCQGSATLLFPLWSVDGKPQGALWAGDLNVEDWLRNKMLATGLWGKTKQEHEGWGWGGDSWNITTQCSVIL